MHEMRTIVDVRGKRWLGYEALGCEGKMQLREVRMNQEASSAGMNA